jgi:hypothetical protein
MKPMVRRLRFLEQAYQVEEYVQREDSLASIIRARRLRRLHAEGKPIPPERPRQSLPRGTTIADVLRQYRLESRRATQAN